MHGCKPRGSGAYRVELDRHLVAEDRDQVQTDQHDQPIRDPFLGVPEPLPALGPSWPLATPARKAGAFEGRGGAESRNKPTSIERSRKEKLRRGTLSHTLNRTTTEPP